MDPIIITIIQVVLLLFLPYFLVRISRTLKIEKILGGVMICYGVGIIFANIKGSLISDKETLDHVFEISKLTSEMSVVFAIPMLLMSCNMLDWLKYTGKITIAFALSIVSVLSMSMLMIYLFKDDLPNQAHTVVGMLSSTFVGGTPNMAAVSKSLDPSGTLFVVLNATDTFATGLYFLFLVSVAPALFAWILPKFKSSQTEKPVNEAVLEQAIDEYKFKWNWTSLKPILIGFGVSACILGLSVGLGMLFATADGKMNNTLVILGLTTFGAAASFITFVRELKGTYEFAQYLLLIFALAAGSLADFGAIVEYGVTFILITVFFLLAVIFLHILLCLIFRIDRDTFLITTTASIFGPPFIGQMVQVLNNREILAAGMAVASLGLALGNYIGILVAKIGALI